MLVIAVQTEKPFLAFLQKLLKTVRVQDIVCLLLTHKQSQTPIAPIVHPKMNLAAAVFRPVRDELISTGRQSFCHRPFSAPSARYLCRTTTQTKMQPRRGGIFGEVRLPTSGLAGTLAPPNLRCRSYGA